MRNRTVSIFALLAIGWLQATVAVRAQSDPFADLNTPGPVTVRAEWSLGHKDGDSRSVIQILFRRPKGDLRGPRVGAGLLRGDSPALRDVKLWKVIATKGNKSEPVRFSIEADEGAVAGGIKAIVLVPEKTPTTELTYTVTLAEPVTSLHFEPGWKLTNPEAAALFTLDNKMLAIDEKFITGNKAIEPKFAFHAGAEAGLSLNAQFGYRNWNNGDPWRIQGLVTADGTYRPKERGHYINSAVGELDFVTVRHYGDVKSTGNLIGIAELGIASRIETDQDFEKVNGTVGVGSWNSINHPWIQSFGRALCLTRNLDDNAQIPTPILVLAYDYVVDIHDDPATSARVTEVGQHRIRGKFYWSAKLAHDFAIPIVSARAATNYDVDLVIEAGGIFDLEQSKFNPDTRISLEVAPMTLGDSKPSFTLTYVNGKTTPKFEHYDAIFGGLKLPF